jgi:hypothetical protein
VFHNMMTICEQIPACGTPNRHFTRQKWCSFVNKNTARQRSTEEDTCEFYRFKKQTEPFKPLPLLKACLIQTIKF